MTALEPLWRALREARRDPPGELATALRALPEPDGFPPPWTTWPLIALVRHRRRQLWVADVVASRLGGDPVGLAAAGAFAHPPDVPQGGLVPGLTEWDYYFHGRGCCLTHRGTGEAIDVDFFGPTGEYFDFFFYLQYLKSLRDPEPPEARLMALHPSREPIRLAVAALLEAGALVPLEGREQHPFRIAERVLEHEDDVDAFCEAWADPGRRLWLAATVGDWPAAHDAASRTGDATLIDWTAVRAAECRAAWCLDLLSDRHGEERRGEVLLALDDLDAPALADELERTLRGPIGGTTSRALRIIRRRDDAGWCPAIYRLFRRLKPDGEIPQPHLWVECQRFLLRHGYRTQAMKESLSRAGGVSVGEAALLAMEHDPGRALTLFRRALRSSIPANRTEAAAILALIDRPWSRGEMLAVLSESDDQHATADCRAALMECHDEEAHRAVLAWEEAYPHEAEPGPWITMGEMMLRNRSQWVRWEMENLHERVMPVRDREPMEVVHTSPGALRRAASWFSDCLRGLIPK